MFDGKNSRIGTSRLSTPSLADALGAGPPLEAKSFRAASQPIVSSRSTLPNLVDVAIEVADSCLAKIPVLQTSY